MARGPFRVASRVLTKAVGYVGLRKDAISILTRVWLEIGAYACLSSAGSPDCHPNELWQVDGHLSSHACMYDIACLKLRAHRYGSSCVMGNSDRVTVRLNLNHMRVDIVILMLQRPRAYSSFFLMSGDGT
jgi:hypothetical protein